MTLSLRASPALRGFGGALALGAIACSRPTPSSTGARSPASASPREPLAPRASQASRWALAHATVLDLRDGSERADQTIVVEGVKIVTVGPALSVSTAGASRVLDVGGAYVMPGLWDMHVHVGDPYALRLFVANGVTGVRVMWGNPPPDPGGRSEPLHASMRASIEAGTIEGPRLVVASQLLDGPASFWTGATKIATAEEGRRAVDDASAAGADFIKVYSGLPREAFFAIADEARAKGLPFAGHVPDAVSAAEASDAGQRSVEHAFGLSLACSSREAELRRRPVPPGYGVAFLRAKLREERDARASYDPAKARALFSRFKANGTWWCPTLSALVVRDPRAPPSEDALAYVPPAQRRGWGVPTDSKFRAAQIAADDYGRESWRSVVALVGRMREAGVPMLAGTDEGNPSIVPGFSLHEELSRLVEAGLTPLEALQSATTGPARFLGREGELGSVEAGKLADLVVLDADPRSDVRRAARPRAVAAGGKLYDRAALDALLDAARREAAAPSAP
jgi:imidazolonepropionase-like amidohydrolase